MTIERKTTPAHKSNHGVTRPASAIKYIVIHYTGNDGDSDEANARYFQTAGRNASAHYFVDDDSITQSVPDLTIAWSVGGKKYADCAKTGGGTFYQIATNSNTINVELCDAKKDGQVMATEKTLDNAVKLIEELMAKYQIPKSRIIRHFDVTGKRCPAYFVDSEKWQEFKARIKELPAAKPEATEYKVTAKDGLNLRTGAGTKYPRIRAMGNGEIFQVDKIAGIWAHGTDKDGHEGFASAQYLKKVSI